MTVPTSLPDTGVLDPCLLERLRVAARQHSPEAVKAAASQFEALFIENVMKGLRDAAPADGLFDSEQSRTLQGMLDQQYARALASRGIGLAEMLARQLAARSRPADGDLAAMNRQTLSGAAGDSQRTVSRHEPSPQADRSRAVNPQAASPQAVSSQAVSSQAASSQAASPKGFVQRLSGFAEAASAATGIPAKFMLAQAALETGWGRRDIRHADGSTSHNLFGVKAGKGWHGPVAEVMTTEYVDGIAQRRVEKFRAYGSYAEAFADYARLLTQSPRYRHVLTSGTDAAGFAQGLQRAGYATDQLYADKLRRVIARV